MLRAIATAKNKNDRIDSGKIADCLRYRHLVIRQMVQMKNRVAGLLLESGVSDDRPRHAAMWPAAPITDVRNGCLSQHNTFSEQAFILSRAIF